MFTSVIWCWPSLSLLALRLLYPGGIAQTTYGTPQDCTKHWVTLPELDGNTAVDSRTQYCCRCCNAFYCVWKLIHGPLRFSVHEHIRVDSPKVLLSGIIVTSVSTILGLFSKPNRKQIAWLQIILLNDTATTLNNN